MQLCWKMAKLAQMELSGIDADEHLPKERELKLVSVADRIAAARRDGRVTAGRLR